MTVITGLCDSCLQEPAVRRVWLPAWFDVRLVDALFSVCEGCDIGYVEMDGLT